MEPPNIDSFFVKRRYAEDDEKAANIYGVFSFPLWKCEAKK